MTDMQEQTDPAVEELGRNSQPMGNLRQAPAGRIFRPIRSAGDSQFFFPRDKKRNSAYCPNLGDSKFCKYFKK